MGRLGVVAALLASPAAMLAATLIVTKQERRAYNAHEPAS